MALVVDSPPGGPGLAVGPVRDATKLNLHLLLNDMCLRINLKMYWIPI